MKKIITILFILLLSNLAFATDYYAGKAGGNINADDVWFTTSTGSCTGSTGVTGATALQSGNTLYANGCSLTVNVSFTATKISTAAGAGAGGGGFAVVTNASPITITAIIEAGTTTCLAVTGNATGSNVLSIIGNATGGSAASTHGVSDSHTVGTVIFQGNATGGSNTGRGYVFSGASGSVSMTGDGIASATAIGYLMSGASSTTTISGDCKGSDSADYQGCYATGAGTITLTGSIINGKRSMGAGGSLIFTPSATDYILYPKDSSYSLGTIDAHATEMPTDPGVSNVKTGTAYGSYTGTYSASGGGGSWAY